jgi:hypothetical protein
MAQFTADQFSQLLSTLRVEQSSRNSHNKVIVPPPDHFDFTSDDDFQDWQMRFDRFRKISGLDKESEEE